MAVAAVPTITAFLFPWCVIAEHADEVVVGNVRTARPPVPKVPSTPAAGQVTHHGRVVGRRQVHGATDLEAPVAEDREREP